MGPEEDIWPFLLAEVLGDPLLQGFILDFCGVSPSSTLPFLPGGYVL